MSQKGKIALTVMVVLILAYIAFALDIPYRDRVDDFETCVAAGNPVMESYPRQCRDKKTGEAFVEEITGARGGDMIRVDFPAPLSGVSSPANFSGQARGNWFFEASFPIEVRSNAGDVLGTGYAEAQGDWMTTDYVPWKATVSFDPKGAREGVVRFKKDNPSGLPENDAYVDVPVRFASAATSTPGSVRACKPTGCSGQICSDEDVASTCEYREEYACYKTAACERQPDGECGWTETASLRSCIQDARRQSGI